MRIVAHNGARILGGAERATTLLMSGLQSRGHDVLMLCNDRHVADYAESSGVPAALSVIGGDVSFLSARRFGSALAEFKPDSLIVGTWKKLFMASWAAKQCGVRSVIARVGLETDIPRSAKYRVALSRWTDGVVVNSERMIHPFASLDGFGANRVRLIHNGIAAPRRVGSRGATRKSLGIDERARVIGTVARLATQKRIDRLLRVTAKLPADVHCVIAGDGGERRNLPTLAASLGIGHRVHFIGHREEKGEVLDAIDLFVVTSDKEGLSNAMLEAMAFGLPVVSTPVSGAAEALRANADGSHPGIVSGFSEDELVRDISALMNDSSRRTACGDAARKRAESDFSVEIMLDRWESALAGLPPAR
jgi:glycosyltransferase involved in cell wall biosynthesis